MNKLIEVLEVQTVSRDDKFMRAYLYNEIATIPGAHLIDDGNNIYVTKGVAPYPCMVAHIDTVHRIQTNLTAITFNGRITGMNMDTMTQAGIGGDDKVGIYVALQMLREYDNIKCFFPKDEEIGCVGSSTANAEFFNDVTIALQCDRKGNKDFITEASGVELSSKAFQADVLPILMGYGYKFEHGMMTDVMELKQNGINVSMANISCGYYNPHCSNEFVDIADVVRVTAMVSEIIKTLGNTFYPHEVPDYFDDGEYWWNDNNQSSQRGIHHDPEFCQDCYAAPASKPDGLCDNCRDWYSERPIPKPSPRLDLAPPVIKTPDDVKRAIDLLYKKKKKKKFGKW